MYMLSSRCIGPKCWNAEVSSRHHSSRTATIGGNRAVASNRAEALFAMMLRACAAVAT